MFDRDFCPGVVKVFTPSISILDGMDAMDRSSQFASKSSYA
jgi:hypothetical protein